MKKTISVYWPLALVVPLAVAAYAYAWNGAVDEEMPLAADRLTAELARAVSYGFVGIDHRAAQLKPMPSAGPAEPPPQSI